MSRQEDLTEAFTKAIKEIGMEEFRKCSFFLSAAENRKLAKRLTAKCAKKGLQP